MIKKPLLNRHTTLVLLFVNAILFLFSIAIITLGVYIIIDQTNMSELFGTSLYTTGVYMLLFFGLVTSIAAIFGCLAATKENIFVLMIHACILCITILFLFISSILVLVFKDSLGASAKESMTSSLKNQYGRQKIVTNAWNMTQSKLRCCGVDDLGWNVYEDSWWDIFVNMDIYEKNSKLQKTSPFYKFVPESCCATIIDGITGWPSNTFRDLTRCQAWQFGPPSHRSGAHNDAIYYSGCFNSLKEYINFHAKAIGSLGLVTTVILVVALVLSVMILISLKRKQDHAKRTYQSHSYASIPYTS
ncbi:unnamed protein product [Calicophoron daubneyi]|uniref:Tetraspanin n=1 Tax=Calicophoron daubneyi TaxID=300641 RepID=A0AAV2T996_CALDB